jgi:hypothetical protein
LTSFRQNEIPANVFMKLPVLCSIALLAAAAASHAGSFGGPPPFTDLSPLQTGIDGSYQATCHGTNLTGIIRFAYQNGVQSGISTGNIYSIFTEGQVVTGGVTASITGKDLAGVLGGQDFTVPTSGNGTSELPLVFIVRGNRANGFFEGQIDLNDRMSAFSGKGELAPAPPEVNTVILIQTSNGGGFFGFNPITTNTGGNVQSSDVTVTPFAIPGSSILPATFEFAGVRTSVFAQATGSNVATAAAAASSQ